MSTPPFPKLKVPPKPQPPQKKKKKNAPDRPQPSWLFPPDEENPVLNPKAKTADDMKKERQERAKSLDYMQRRVHAAPDRPAPPPQLLTMIGIFLTDFGFNSSSRIFTNERKARQTLKGWEDALGKKVEKGTPTLEKIYRDWYRDWKVGQKDETSSSGSDNESSGEEEDIDVKVEARGSSDDDSEASSDGFGGSDVDMKQTSKAKKGKAVKKESKKMIDSSSSGSSTSDSDADDEKETVSKVKKATSIPKATVLAPAKPTVAAMINSLKRKAPTSSSESGSSDDEKSLPTKKTKTDTFPPGDIASTSASKQADSSNSSSSSSESEQEVNTKSPKATVKSTKASGTKNSASGGTPSDPSDTSDSDSSASEADRDQPMQQVNGVALPKLAKASSDSSATINGDTKKVYSSATSSSATSSTPSSDSDAAAHAVPPAVKKKHQGAKPTPLAELSAKATDDSHISNKYQPYDYAERAYQDLSVTRGKGFTKEKNKKKRGSYRGGAIDMSGGKGYKFED